VDSYLKKMVYLGLKDRYPEITPEIDERATYELGVITDMGFSSYFLITADFIQWARDNDILVGPGRGSAGGSLVSYAMKISNIDPIKYKLLFERFLNPERISMPDIDVDFCVRGRDKVIGYVEEKYGKSNVSQIITFNTMAAKMVIRDIGRVMGVPLTEVDAIAKLIPTRPGIKIKQALQEEPELKALYESKPIVKELIDKARKLEGMTRGVGTHASGVVISKLPLDEVVPLEVVRDSANKKTSIVTQFTMTLVEQLGLLKMDFLGLRNLTIIDDTVKMLKKTQNIDLDMDKLPLEDKSTFEVYQTGKTMGVFQSESPGIRKLMKKLKPSVFDDIVALVALYRPGPLGSGMVDQFIDRKHGRAKMEYELPELEEILKETYGLILYQEQVMLISVEIGGFSMADADKLRKAMGKKKFDIMAQLREKFLKGAKAKDIDVKKAGKVYDLCAEFAKYGFNKSHSVAYGLLSYQTAYLKAHYPLEFLSAVLDSIATDDIQEDNSKSKSKDMDKVAEYLNEADRIGIEVLPPSINESEYRFSPVNGTIRFGLGAIKNLSSQGAFNIVTERKKNGIFNSFRSFCERVDLKNVNKKSLESLILSGAMDFFGSRKALLEAMPMIVTDVTKNNSRKNLGEVSLFSLQETVDDSVEEFIGAHDYSDHEKLKMEKIYLGIYLSDHPLKHVPNLKDYAQHIVSDYLEGENTLGDVEIEMSMVEDTKVVFAGMFATVTHMTTKSGKKMAKGIFEDLSGSIQFLIFPNVYDKVKDFVADDFFVVIKGTVSRSSDETIMKVSELKMLPVSKKNKEGSVHIELTQHTEDETIAQLKKIFMLNKGNSLIYVHLDDKTIRLGNQYKVKLSLEVKEEVEQLVGQGSIWEG